MKKIKANSFGDLLIFLVFGIILIGLLLPVFGLTGDTSRYKTLVKIESTINEAIKNQRALGKPIQPWTWQSEGDSVKVMNEQILPAFGKYTTCDKTPLCPKNYADLAGEHRLDYEPAEIWPRGLIFNNRVHLALYTPGRCKNNYKSICGYLYIDINNRFGENKLGKDVYLFTFHGDGSFLPYGYFMPDNVLYEKCAKDGETCAMKEILEYEAKLKEIEEKKAKKAKK